MVFFYIAIGFVGSLALGGLLTGFLFDDPLGYFGTILGGAVVAGIAALVLNLFFVDQEVNTTLRVHHSIRLVSIRTGEGNSAIHGGIFIGVSGGGSHPIYTYYSPNPDGSFSLHEIRATPVEVFEDSTPQDARIDCYHPYVTRVNGHLLSIWQPKIGADVSDYGCDKKVIHVPPGSIVRDFVLK